ncbi:MAG: chorismate synthase [Syntrophorhabdaceae bacterium]|nr:chorismate synthase [Syntrophorhabdaceae bacterium]
MNSFGRIFRVSIFGESHGKGVGIVIDGCPAGVPVDHDDFNHDLKRRRAGQPGTTPRREGDIPIIESGVYNGRTTGAPITILFENRENISEDYASIRNRVRPGHADFTAYKKYGGFNDYRGGGQFSGRLTVGLVAAGVIAKKVIKPVEVRAELIEAGGITDIEYAVKSAMEVRDSVGGIILCRVEGVPVGLGEPFFDSVESLIGHIVFSIPGVKGIEFGAGFAGAGMRGSEFNDRILDISGKTETNNAGGINGGITNGNEVFFKVAIRPTASIGIPQKTVDIRDGSSVEISVGGRHDVCFALRVPVIIEAVTAIVFADLMMLNGNIGRIWT